MYDTGILKGKRIGFAMTGSFCTFARVFEAAASLAAADAQLYPILSDNAWTLDTRFFRAEEVRRRLEDICGRPIWHTLPQVEPIGPKKLLDLLVIAPCTGNTLGKLASGVFDTPAAMAAKSHLRNERPLLLAVSTNDGLAMSARSIGSLLAWKNVYFVPFGQDDPQRKPASLVAHMESLPEAAAAALAGRQIQPLLCAPPGGA